MSPLEKKPAKGKFFRPLVFSFLAVAAFFLFAEAALRLAGFRYEGFRGRASWWARWDEDLYEADPVLFWKLRPGREHRPTQPGYMRINSFGFRDDELPVAKPKGTYRIFTLGDSCTFGDGVSNDETYANVAGRLLNGRFPEKRIDVINAGVPGYTSYQARRLLERDLLRFEPDAITVYVGINDGIPVRSGMSDAMRGRKSVRAWNARLSLAPWRTYQFMEFIVLRFVAGQGPPPVEFDIGLAFKTNVSEGTPVRVPKVEFFENLSAIAGTCGERGVRLLLLTNPTRGGPDAENSANTYLREFSARRGVSIIDLYRAFKPLERSGVEQYDPPGGHPNVEGHALIGGLLADWFAARLLNSGPGVD